MKVIRGEKEDGKTVYYRDETISLDSGRGIRKLGATILSKGEAYDKAATLRRQGWRNVELIDPTTII